MGSHCNSNQNNSTADNGSDNFISGAPDERWNADAIAQINRVKNKDLEVIEMTDIVTEETPE